MIKLVEKDDEAFSRFCDRDVFGTRIKTYYNCYSTDYDFVDFWKQIDSSGKIKAVISKIDSDITVSAQNCDCEELLPFLKMTGFASLQCEKKLAENLTAGETLNGFVVEYKRYFPNKEPCLKKNFELKEIYNIIKAENLLGTGEYLPWLSDVTYRINRKAAEAALVQYEGENAGCAMVLFRTDKASLLGGVATVPKMRGKGIASSLVSYLALREKREGRRVELLCKADSIVDFYKSAGFETVNEWSLITDAAELF